MSVLEGGYNINGGHVSAFARSVAAHVRGLAESHSQVCKAALVGLISQACKLSRAIAAVITVLGLLSVCIQQGAKAAEEHCALSAVLSCEEHLIHQSTRRMCVCSVLCCLGVGSFGIQNRKGG